jgi:hypothetical protein
MSANRKAAVLIELAYFGFVSKMDTKADRAKDTLLGCMRLLCGMRSNVNMVDFMLSRHYE